MSLFSAVPRSTLFLSDLDGTLLDRTASLPAEDAARMLRKMSGGHHFVHTGVTVTDGVRTMTETVSTGVVMRKLTEREIEGYIGSGEPFDKAGAYGIQGIAAAFVESLEGDYFNVMGLPICRVCEILGTFGIGLFDRK